MTTPQLEVALYVSLGITVAVLAAAVVMAKQHRVRAHIGLIGGFLACFAATLVFAEMLGRRYEFAHVSYPIHLSIAIFTAAFTLAPLGTGFRHWKGQGSLQAHKVTVGIWGACVVAALGTGVWMLGHGVPRPESVADAEGR